VERTAHGIHGAVSRTRVDRTRVKTCKSAPNLERLDRASANAETILFDRLTVGAVDMTRPRLNFVRTANKLELSWPAAGMGFKLQAASNLMVPTLWTPLTNGISLTNGQSVFTITVSTGSQFYRLRSP